MPRRGTVGAWSGCGAGRAGGSAARRAALAVVPWAAGVRCRRRHADAGHLECAGRPERRLEGADRRARGLEPDRLGRSRLRLDRGEQRPDRHLPSRPLRRRRAVGGRVAGTPGACSRSTSAAARCCGTARRTRAARRPSATPSRARRRRRPSPTAGTVVVSFGSEGLYAYDLDGSLLWTAGPRRAERRLVLRSRLRMGRRQLADHLERPGDRPVRHPEEVVPRRVRRRDRQAGLAHVARRDSGLVHADDLPGRRARGARDPGHELHPRLRSEDRHRAVAARAATPR